MNLPAAGPSASVQKYGLQKLKPFHDEIARRLITGQRPEEVSIAMNITPARLSIITNSPIFQQRLERLQALRDAAACEAREFIEEVALVAATQIEKLMLTSADDRVKLSAAKDLLDRAGFQAQPPTKNLPQLSVTVEQNISPVDLSRYRTTITVGQRLAEGETLAGFRGEGETFTSPNNEAIDITPEDDNASD